MSENNTSFINTLHTASVVIMGFEDTCLVIAVPCQSYAVFKMILSVGQKAICNLYVDYSLVSTTIVNILPKL